MSSRMCIMVAAHKDYTFPSDPGFLPVQVGRANSTQPLWFQGDDDGENISSLNQSFCELTGLYWMWRNRQAEFYGLSHYRRYFASTESSIELLGKNIASSVELMSFLDGKAVILSKPRNYWIETVREHYKNAHHINDLNVVEEIIQELFPEYLPSFNRVMVRRKVSLYNMFVMRSADFNAYCEWLFSILFEAQKRIPYQSYGPYQKRVFGFLAERLLNVWVEKNYARNQIQYLPVVNLEGENLFKKAVDLLKRKFMQSRLA